MNEENKKYIITIDGPDCSGKTYTWTNLQDKGLNVQIRGILSNIAYGLKYGRNVDEMINMYNKNPLNYKIYLLDLKPNIRVNRLYSRLKSIYDNDTIICNLKDAIDTWKDNEYFDKAIEILTEKYKGRIEVTRISWQIDVDNLENTINTFINEHSTYSMNEIRDFNNKENGIIVLNEPIDTFEKVAKEKSEFKYIIFNDTLDKATFIERLYNKAKDNDSDIAKMFDNLIKLTNKSYEEIYDEIFNYCDKEKNAYDAFAEYLEDYELNVEVYARVAVDTTVNLDVKLSEYSEFNYEDIEDYIYDNSDAMDEIINNLEDEVRYGEFDTLNVNEVK